MGNASSALKHAVHAQVLQFVMHALAHYHWLVVSVSVIIHVHSASYLIQAALTVQFY